MKKFFVGLISLFIVLGGIILTACRGNSVEISLSTEYLSIQLVEGASSEQTVTVTVSGTDDTTVSADARGYEDKIDVWEEPIADGRTLIHIVGKEETDGYAEVQIRTYQGNATKTIYVEVYSEVSAMEEKIEEGTRKNNFAIRGDSVELIEDNLLTFYPSENSRRTITWSLAEGVTNASIDGNILTIDSSYNPLLTSITLIATTELGVSCQLELPVIDRIEERLSLAWAYSRDTQSYETINEYNNTFTIVPRIASNPNYIGYVKLDCDQELDVDDYVLNSNGELTSDLIVEADGEDNFGNQIYSIYSNKSLENSSQDLNRDFVVHFEVGYSGYNYSISTRETNPIYINVRERVNDIIISNEENNIDNIAGTTQVLYSEYSNTYGAQYLVEVTPTTVIDATKRYSISVRITNPNLPAGGLADGCPVEFWYQDVNNNNIWTQIVLEYDALQDVYTTRANNMVSVERIHMKASSSLNTQNFEGIEITFRSEDNPEITNTFYAQLVKSVSYKDFVFENADFRVDSTASTTDVNITKTFELVGQTSVEGLYIRNNSSHVTISQPAYITSTADSVTFSITLTLRRESYGITSLDSYQICHNNGLESKLFDIDIFLPLKEVAVLYDVSNATDSVTNHLMNNLSYDSNGNVIIGERDTLASIMIKNGSTTPILYAYNTSGEYQAQANIDVSYYDFVESDTMDIETFKTLLDSQAGIMEVINGARANINKTSDIAYFSPDYANIITKGVGFTYAVLTFTGKSAEVNGEGDGTVTIIKIVLIESYVSPSRMNVSPLSDGQVNLYSANSVATRDEALTKKTITIDFANSGVTYNKIENFDFVSTVKDSSGNPIMKNKYVTENSVSWEDGRYTIDNITITDSFIRFDIETISNFGSFSFFDELEVHYQLIIENQEGESEILNVIWTTINITIRNAQRVTNLVWENSDDDGIYFEVGQREPYYLVLSSAPSTARNNNVAYLVTDDAGNVLNDGSFVSVDDTISSNMIGLSLNEAIVQKTTGYVYLLPEDAVYNGNIVYNYIDEDGQTKQSQISANALGSLRSNETWYDYLVENAFFLSSTSLTSEAETVYFADILIKIEITVADGTDFDYAYRIYDEERFNTIDPNLYYTVMNSLNISSSRSPITSFNGGLQGYNEDVTITLNGSNFATELSSSAEIRNITFAGTVAGQGFVANTNKGAINNVTVDVYQTYASIISYQGAGFVGGIVGVNDGTISHSEVLGVTIDADNAIVGGIAGQNNSVIEYSTVEFYNLFDRENSQQTTYSTFTGNVIGGIVGQANNGSTIDHSYAYNYNIDNFTTDNLSVFAGATVGAIVGQLSGQSLIYYSFAVIDNVSSYVGSLGQGSVSASSDFYWSYYNNGEYISEYFNNNSVNLIASGENFYSYVNNGNRHFRDLYQDEKVTDVSSNQISTVIEDGFYKSLSVDADNAILFVYQLQDSVNDLSSTALNDLNELNTISLSQIINAQVSENLIITSSDTSIVRIIGNSLNLLRSGEVLLTISSKHDASNQKNINIKVMPAMSKMIIQYTDNSGYTYNIADGSITHLQKTKSRDFTIGYEVTSLILGSDAQRYFLVQNDINLSLVTQSEGKAVNYEKISNSIYKINVDSDSSSTLLTFNPIVTNDANYQEAINKEFSKAFTINPVDGVISFYYTGESIPLTPSTNGALRVEIQTTAQEDRENLRPEISYNGDSLYRTRIDNLSSGDITVYRYTLPSDYTQDPDNYIFTTTVTLINESYNQLTGVYNYIFEVSFSVYSDYKSQVDQEMTFDVSFISNSQSNSLDTSNSIKLTLTKQNFTSVDITNFRVNSSVWQNVNGTYVTTHTKGSQVGVVSPGSNSIMQITVNPAYAHYDYMELSYSGATVSSAVSFELLTALDDNRFIRNSEGVSSTWANNISFTPSQDSIEKQTGIIYFRIAVSSTVNVDTVLQFTASFYESEGNLLTRANYYLTISYLAQPTVTIDGQSTAYLAVGSSVEVLIQVQEDQVLESLVLDGDSLQGITISNAVDQGVNPTTRIKTYIATLNATVNASVGAVNNSFAIVASVSRTLNGVPEQRRAMATVVLVDFKLDQNNIQISGANNGQLQVWLGVNKTFDVEYGLLPESYNYDQNDEESANRVQELLDARANFSVNQYYLSTKSNNEGLTTIQYAINYDITNNTPIPLSNRLFYVVDGSEIPVTDQYSMTAGARFEFINNEDGSQEAVIVGTRLGETVQFVLKTYIVLGDGSEPTTYNTYFNVVVYAYSDPDIPLTISSATEFENLDPSGYSQITQNDYILTNDIVLENYQPFNTSLIRSLDGNGYTIFIKSFLTSSSSSTLNLALFNQVLADTTLKNVRVNIYNGGQLTIDLAQLQENVQINIAGLAISNAGTITNCEVVSFYTEETAIGSTANVNVVATVRHNNPSGFNIKFIRGANTTESVTVNPNSSWIPSVAGFVLNNNGSITNSRVGGKSITILGAERVISTSQGTNNSGFTYASELELDTFYIIGQGDMAGFVLTNTGSISASFVQLLDMENQSNTTEYDTSGFVNLNSGKIITSFVEGVENPDSFADNPDYSQFAYEGSSLKSNLGIIAGFINTNNGIIKDSYSNILISNSSAESRVYLASGFVYANIGTIETCYSASQIENLRANQMNFSGITPDGEPLANGTYINCYFFNKGFYNSEDDTDNTTESLYATGAVLVPNPEVASYFYGFAIADGESDGIWSINETEGIKLIEPNIRAYSHRYIQYINEESDYEGITGQNDIGEYILPYATLQYTDSSREIDTALGSENNPILIANAQDFAEVTGASNSTYVSSYYNSYAVWGTYRLVSDIDLSQIGESINLPSVSKSFAGRLYGNGFTITNLSIAPERSGVAYGLFASLESRNGSTPLISNLNLEVNQVLASEMSMVGSLAGYIKDSILVSIEVNFNEGATVTGLNFVGGLVGLSFGNSTIKNIVVTNPNVTADRFNVGSDDEYITTSNIINIRNNISNNLSISASIGSTFMNLMQRYSYAGSVVGYADHFTTSLRAFSVSEASSYTINNIRVSGEVNVQAQVVGGVFGLTGHQTHIRDVGIDITAPQTNNQSHIIATRYFAGGVIGQSFGGLSRIYAQYESSIQDTIENSFTSIFSGNSAERNSAERGATDIFYLENTIYDYSQKYIGGLIGYVGSGRLEVSYSKLNVISLSADFAGGIIGGIDLTHVGTYQAESSLMSNDDVFTKYYINEVYASGDVRARQDGEVITAGGIIGVSYGLGNRISLLAVNALNQIVNYDYANDTYLSFEADSNISYAIKTNLIVGSVFEDITSTQPITLVNDFTQANHYANFISLIKLEGSVEGAATGGAELPSFGYYEYYAYDGNRAYLNLFGEVSAEIPETFVDNEDSLYYNNYIYAINNPADYTSATTGHLSTQQAFLSSGVWVTSNWIHPGEDLFPTIRYQRTTSYIYLDDYDESVQNAFDIMQHANSDYTIVVRGRTGPNVDDVYSDIDLSDYWDRLDIQPINGFAGALIGSNEYISSETGERVKIISDRSFIDATGVGFYLNNVVVEYRTDGDSIELEPVVRNEVGLFSKGAIREATISSLYITVSSPIVAENMTNGGGSEFSFGLLASSITSSALSNINITTSIRSTDSVVTVNLDNRNNTLTSASIGMVAGEANQQSTYSILELDGINITSTSNFITVNGSGNKLQTLNVGGYFGAITRDENALETRMDIASITRQNTSTQSSNPRITVTNFASLDNAYIGGYVGYNNGLNNLGIFQNEPLQTHVDIVINNTSSSGTPEIANLYTGLIFGSIESASILNNINLFNGNFDGGLYLSSRVTVNNLYAGGFAGKISGMVSLSNITSINYQVADSDLLVNSNSDNLSQDSFNTRNYDKFTVNMNGKARIGVIAGLVETRFAFAGGDLSYTRLNENGEAIRLSGSGDIAVGSVVGEVNSTVSNTTDSSLQIDGNIVSYANIVVVEKDSDTANAKIGGMVGYVGGGDTAGGNDSNARVVIGSPNASINYLGAVYTNIEDSYFGGIVGEVHLDSANDRVTLTNTVFGGALKVFGRRSSNVYAGGSVGYLRGTTGLSLGNNYNIYLTNNYNYGDVFVEYDSSLTQLSSYTFGGLIGQMETNYKLNATNNYSIVSSHNARYDESKEDSDTASTNNALFGVGVNPKTSHIDGNYYSYGVSLCTDELGVDIGYHSNYQVGAGYNGSVDSSSQTNMIFIFEFSDKIKIYVSDELPEGHKLNPIEIGGDSNSTKIDTSNKLNGMTYACFVGSSTLSSQITAGSTPSGNLENIALIGDSREINYRLNSTSTEPNSLIDTLSGFSYVSGLVVNVDINVDISKESVGYGRYMAGLANTMQDNSLVYAVQVKGTLDVGGDKSLNVGGIVANLSSGKILDSSTALDIIYRAKGKESASALWSNVYGIAGVINVINNRAYNKYIINCYSTGSITSYISADIYAVTDVVNYTKVANTYSIANISPNDYTTSREYSGEISVFGISERNDITGPNTEITISNSFYDYYAISCDVTEDEGFKSTSPYVKRLGNLSPKGLYNIFNTQERVATAYDSGGYEFNYGYPTHPYGFMKLSSFATISSSSGNLNFSDNAVMDGTTYDDFVIEREYSRLANNTYPNPNKDDLYYMITNVGQLEKLTELTISGANNTTYKPTRFILMNDMDISDLEFTWKSLAVDPDPDTDTGIEFDGQEHTITGLTAPLFGTPLRGATILNLRLMDASITGSGVLTQRLERSTVSNMTISGSVSEDSSIDESFVFSIGGLVNEASGSNITNITNLVKIDAKKPVGGDGIAVGGIVGTSTNSKIYYSSNYGPINVALDSNTDPEDEYYEAEYYVGGITGYTYGGTIIFRSYNATSVMAGYATATGLSTTPGEYYVGGVCGYGGKVTIQGCYNSGAIKSGNKSNGVTLDTGTTNGFSYAGGIIGYGRTMSSVYSCYNEGTVEALGASPVTNFELRGSLVLKQTSARNVWAFAIGYLRDGNKYSISSVAVKDASANSIFANGSALASGTIIHAWSFNEITSKISTDGLNNDMIDSGRLWWRLEGFMGALLEDRSLTTKYSISASINEPGSLEEEEQIYVNSYNSFGLPQSFVVKVAVTLDVEGWYYRGNLEDWQPGDKDDFRIVGLNGGTFTNYDYAAFDYNTSYTDYTNGISGDFGFVGFVGQEDGKVEWSLDNGNSFKYLTRSSESFSTADTDFMTTIAGETYYLGLSNNINSLFNTGLYLYNFEVDISDLPFVNNLDVYTITASSGDNTLSVGKNNFTDGNTKIEVTVYSEEELKSIDYSVSFDYQEEVYFDINSLNYYYIDEYSIGMTLVHGPTITTIDGYTLQTTGGKIYQGVVKMYRHEEGSTPPETEVLDESQSDDYIYFAYDQKNNMLIYIPNATLTTIDGSQITVNKDEVNDMPFSSSNIEGSIQTIVNSRFNGASYYYITSSSIDRTSSITFTQAGQASAETNAGGTASGKVELSYGQTVSGWFSNNIVEGTDAQSRTFTVSLRSLGLDTLVFSNTNTPILAYSTATDSWSKSASFNNVLISGTAFDVQISNNQLTFTINTSTTGDCISLLESYLNSLSAYANNFSATATLPDLYDKVTADALQLSFDTAGRTGYLYLRNTVEKTYNVDNLPGYLQLNDNQLSFVTDGNYISASNLVSHTLNGITVYQGALEIEYEETCDREFTVYHISLDQALEEGETLVYNIFVGDYNMTRVYTATRTTSAFTGNLPGNPSNIDIGEGDVTYGIGFNSYYQKTELDKNSITVVLKDSQTGEDYVVNASVKDGAVINNVVFLANDSDQTFYYLKYKENGSDYTIYDQNDVQIFSRTTEKGSTYFIYYYDENGYIDMPEGDITSQTNVTTDLSGWSGDNIFTSGEESIVLDDLIDINTGKPELSYESYSQMLQREGDIIYVDSRYTVQKSLTANKLDLTTQEFTTSITRADYEWVDQKTTTPSYATSQASFLLDSTANEVTVSVTTNDGHPLTEGQHFIVDGNTITVILNNRNSTASSSATALVELNTNSDTLTGTYDVDNKYEPLEARPIILMSDVSLRNIGMGFRKSENVNIIGNGYYLSYYITDTQGSLFLELNSGFIKDIKLLAEGQNKSLIFNGSTITSDLSEVELYGASINVNKSNYGGAIINASEQTTNNIEITNYASISGFVNTLAVSTSNSIYDLTLLTNTGNASLTNYGVIISADGRDGANNTTTSSNGNGAGYDGSDGGNIVLYVGPDPSAEPTFTNNGLFITGSGGNGGAGRSTERGSDNIDSVALDGSYKPDDAGEGGTGGVPGQVVTILDNSMYTADINGNSVSGLCGINGLSGARGRYGLGGMEYVQGNGDSDPALCTRDEVFIRYEFYTVEYLKLRYVGEQTEIEVIKSDYSGMEHHWDVFTEDITPHLEKVFKAEGEYATQYPTGTDDEGNVVVWDGSNYATLLEDANRDDSN